MHVAVDGVGNHVGGGWSVLSRTIQGLAADRRVERISVFCSPLDLVASPPPLSAKITWVEHGREHRSPRARLAWFSIGLDSEVDRVKADVVLSLNAVGRTSRPRVCVVQQAFTVWGNLGRIRPRTFAAKLAVLRRETAKSVRQAQAVVVQTSWMRAQVARTLGSDSHVLPLGLIPARAATEHTGTKRLVTIGGDLPYKRRDVVAAAAEIARQRLPGLEFVTVDDVSPDEVVDELTAASVLLVCSDVESLGLPIVEAFAVGCPVVLTDRPWSRAVADNGAGFFDHGVAAAAARQVVEVIREPQIRADLVRRGGQRLQSLWRSEPYTRLADLLEEVA